jgi:hypothetical protein
MTTTPLTDQQLAENVALKNRVAAAFEHMDAHQWGYDHGFCGTYGVDPETDSFVDAALAVVQAELAALDDLRIRALDKNEQLRAELADVREHLDALALVKVWRNEDGREFLFADDVRAVVGTPANPAAAVPSA